MEWIITVKNGTWCSVYVFTNTVEVWQFVESVLIVSREENTTVNIKLIKGGNYER